MSDLDELRATITTQARRLVDPAPQQILRDDGTIDETRTPSLLALLTRAIMANSGGTTRGRRTNPTPVSLEALDLHAKIASDFGVRPADLHTYIATLPDIARTVRDPDWLTDTDATLRLTITEIEHLLDPPRRLEAVAECPACSVRTVHRRNDTGELVRQPALLIDPTDGCTCQACRAHWPREQLEHLALVLGCQPLPN